MGWEVNLIVYTELIMYFYFTKYIMHIAFFRLLTGTVYL